jgi:hypothetical protein
MWSLSGLPVVGEVKEMHKYFLCCLPNLHAVFWSGKTADKLTRSAVARLLVSFLRLSVSLQDSRGTHPIWNTLEWILTPTDLDSN